VQTSRETQTDWQTVNKPGRKTSNPIKSPLKMHDTLFVLVRQQITKKQGVIGKIFELRALKLSRKIVPCINRKAEEELPRQSAMPIKYTPRVRKDQGDLAQTMRNKNTIFGRNKLHLTLAIDCQITMLQ